MGILALSRTVSIKVKLLITNALHIADMPVTRGGSRPVQEGLEPRSDFHSCVKIHKPLSICFEQLSVTSFVLLINQKMS